MQKRVVWGAFFCAVLLTVLVFGGEKPVRILIDQTRLVPYSETAYYFSMHDLNWYGISDFVNLLRSRGYVVESLDKWPFTPETFLRVDVLIIPESEFGYRDSEIEAIKEFVAQGGGLFVGSRMWYGETQTFWGTKRLVEAFGSTFFANGRIFDKKNCYFWTYPRSWIPIVSAVPGHPITEGVKSVYYQGTYVGVPEGATVLLQSSPDSWFDYFTGGHFANRKDKDEPNGPFPVMIAFTYGLGRVVIAGDASFLMNDWMPELDAKQLAQNIVEWLAKKL
jgi:hypothetical protein